MPGQGIDSSYVYIISSSMFPYTPVKFEFLRFCISK